MSNRRGFIVAVALGVAVLAGVAAAQSKWAGLGPDGKLVYSRLSTGDRIPDFSFAGYKDGGVAIPAVPAKVKLTPTGGDDTSAIQKAIDQVQKMPLVDGVRGAVELAAGTYRCGGTLTINASGVVLRGAGNGKNGSVIQETGEPRVAIVVQGKLNVASAGASTTATANYIPFGATTIEVKSASGFHVGDTVRISKPVTQQWINMLGMDKLTRPGRNEHWIKPGTVLEIRRRVTAVSGNTLTLEIALMDSYEAKWIGAGAVKVERVAVSGQVTNVGVESLRVESPAWSGPLEDAHFTGMEMNDAADAWVRDVNFVEATEGIRMNSGSERVTLQRVDVSQTKFVTSPAKPFDFSINGTEVLLDRCTGTGNQTFYVATQERQQGPVVVLHGLFHGNGNLEPHQRWSTGLLVDSTAVPESGIHLQNRGTMGSGHGWTIGWSVSWNNTADNFVIQQAPGTLNWSIGDVGKQVQIPMPQSGGTKGAPLPFGQIDSPGKHVLPASLYLEQLKERLGAQALVNIGY